MFFDFFSTFSVLMCCCAIFLFVFFIVFFFFIISKSTGPKNQTKKVERKDIEFEDATYRDK